TKLPKVNVWCRCSSCKVSPCAKICKNRSFWANCQVKFSKGVANSSIKPSVKPHTTKNMDKLTVNKQTINNSIKVNNPKGKMPINKPNATAQPICQVEVCELSTLRTFASNVNIIYP